MIIGSIDFSIKVLTVGIVLGGFGQCELFTGVYRGPTRRV